MPVVINSTSYAQGLTSKAFHITQWTLVAFGIVGNLSVVAWRCKRSGRSNGRLLSMLIISLAFADLLLSCQYLLKELTVLSAVFGSSTNNFTLTDADIWICFTTNFLTFMSVNATMFTVVAIALQTYFVISGMRYGCVIVISVVVTGWVLSLAAAVLITYNFDLDHLESLLLADGSPASFIGIIYIHFHVKYAFFALCINGTASLVCSFVYIAVLVKIRKLRKLMARHETNLGSLQIRMTIIVFLSIISWWLPGILLGYNYITGDNMRNGRLDPRFVESVFALTAVSSAANPVIYTISWKPFRQLVKRMCSFSCGNCDRVEDRSGVLGTQREDRVCYCRLWRNEGWDTIDSSYDTEETSAFDSYCKPLQEIPEELNSDLF